MSRRRATILLMFGYWLVGLAAGLCFKEGGTDASHRLLYFVGGNILGISSTALLMGVYSRMNINLAMVLATSGGFILLQFALWAIYRTPITWVQWLGILLVGVGIALAVAPGGRQTVVSSAEAPASPPVGAREEG